jgi:hypothetical protein
VNYLNKGEQKMFTPEQLNILQYIAEECERQGSGGASVYNMLKAWEYAFISWDNCDKLTIEFIEEIGKLVEPEDNKKGFRQIRIFVSDDFTSIEKSPWERVPEQLQHLIDSYYEGLLEPSHKEAETPEDQFYFEYENIHPFRDGNGRSGKIIYNFLLGKLNNPWMVPNFWGYDNP